MSSIEREGKSPETVGFAQVPDGFRAGFVAIIGRPNVGKSTLTNVMVGSKVAITSARPETTRRAIRGVVHLPAAQLVLVDTPGIHRPRTLLGERLNEMADEPLAEVDAVVVCFPADQSIGPGDRYILSKLDGARFPVIAAVTKTDLVSPDRLVKALQEVSQVWDFQEIVPVSARTGYQVDLLTELLVALMPLSPPLYPADQVSDESVETRIAELVREAALSRAREELPHSIAAQVEEIIPADDDTVQVVINLFVERDSQKGIVIGHRGAGISQIRRRVQRPVSLLLGRKAHLDIHVRTAKNWQRDPKMLVRLGF